MRPWAAACLPAAPPEDRSLGQTASHILGLSFLPCLCPRYICSPLLLLFPPLAPPCAASEVGWLGGLIRLRPSLGLARSSGTTAACTQPNSRRWPAAPGPRPVPMASQHPPKSDICSVCSPGPRPALPSSPLPADSPWRSTWTTRPSSPCTACSRYGQEGGNPGPASPYPC